MDLLAIFHKKGLIFQDYQNEWQQSYVLTKLYNIINILVNCCQDDLSAKMSNKFGYANILVNNNLDSLVSKNQFGK